MDCEHVDSEPSEFGRAETPTDTAPSGTVHICDVTTSGISRRACATEVNGVATMANGISYVGRVRDELAVESRNLHSGGCTSMAGQPTRIRY